VLDSFSCITTQQQARLPLVHHNLTEKIQMAQQTPPPYLGIDGLYVQTDKHVDTTLAQFNGNARPGQLVVDTANYALYVGNAAGQLNPISGGGGGSATWKTLGDKTTGVNAPTEIALGAGAGVGTVQGYGAIALGENAGSSAQGQQAVAIGSSAGQTGQTDYAVAIGINAGSTSQGDSGVSIGAGAGTASQGAYSVAIGESAGSINQSDLAVAVGSSAGVTGQGLSAVAIGTGAGGSNQGANAVSIGRNAGSASQGTESIAIGTAAGTATQAPNSIVLNATGTALNNTVPGSLVIRPVRGLSAVDISNAGGALVYYIPSTGEFVYNNGM
jgi:hypothetical protein